MKYVSRETIKRFFKLTFFILIVLYLVNMKYPPKAMAQESPPPNRPKVVRVYSNNAVKWDYKTEPYLDFADQKIVNKMLDEGLKELTGKESIDLAWRDILSPYTPSDKVVIKPNFNAINHGYKNIITSPQVINAVIKGLVESLGISEKNIYIYDLCKIIPDDILRRRIPYAVNYIQASQSETLLDKIVYRLKRLLDLDLNLPDTSAPIRMREKVFDHQGQPVTCYIPKVLTQAQHLINIPLFTNHIFLLASGPLKNHFGTVRFSTYDRYPTPLHGKILEKSIVDINLNPHIKDKTRLIVYDALWGVYSRGEGNVKRKWKTFPSDNGTPNSLFLARDPVAVESVATDYITKERTYHGYKILSHEYLHDAMAKGLGVHEHWDETGNYKKINYIQKILNSN